MFALTLKEFRLLFLTPRAWTLLGIGQLLLAWLLLVRLEEFLKIQSQLNAIAGAPGVTELIVAPLIDSATVIFMLTLPMVTMRMFSQEFRDGTFDLLLSSPLSATKVVVGKYIAVLALVASMLLLTALLVFLLEAGTTLDRGTTLAALAGLALSLGAYGAIGLFVSSLSSQPSTAAVTTYGALLLLWLLDLAPLPESGISSLHWIGFSSHVQPLFSGLVDSADVAYFILLILTFLALTVRRLDNLRLGG